MNLQHSCTACYTYCQRLGQKSSNHWYRIGQKLNDELKFSKATDMLWLDHHYYDHYSSQWLFNNLVTNMMAQQITFNKTMTET